jgi:hypothetical protein
MKIRRITFELFYTNGQTDGQMERKTDGQTDLTKLLAAFRTCFHGPKTYD